MDAFALIIFGGIAALILALLAIGRFYPGSGAEVLDWKTPQSHMETQVGLELEDMDQMLEAQNARRRRRGLPELTEEGMREKVAQDLRDAEARRDAYRREHGQDDLQEMLAATNARRRRHGKRELTVEELDAHAGPAQAPAPTPSADEAPPRPDGA